ncbi:hypothetical protein GCM10022236_19220 [Microlunatus ginsengisoli]|uniref:Uncharacterized protein n=1 Tax=Microlunatus ginsengisoli TaxID=363863 RepID=A0ABP6ZRY1_9ACTN
MGVELGVAPDGSLGVVAGVVAGVAVSVAGGPGVIEELGTIEGRSEGAAG